MRNLIFVLSICALLLSSLSCGNCGLFGSGTAKAPGPPYGDPDDRSIYASGDYESVTYTYYCYDGQYRSVTFTRTDACSDYERSDYTSDCIE